MVSPRGWRAFVLYLSAGVIALSLPAFAGTVDIFSDPGHGTNNQGGVNIAIPASPVWEPSGAGYEWISYGNTGCNYYDPTTGMCTPGPQNPPGVDGPITVDTTPTAIFYQTFTLLDASYTGILNVWADDTAAVWLDIGTVTTGTGSGGTMLMAANSVAAANCADGPISCIPGGGAAIPLTLAPGTYTLVFDTYQFATGSPFGLMYSGVLNSTVPEPASYILMGLGLAGLGTLMRRRRRS